MASCTHPTPRITETPTVLWELRKGGTRLTCSVRLTSEGLRLEEAMNEGAPFVQVTVKTQEKLLAVAETFRQQDMEDGWTDADD